MQMTVTSVIGTSSFLCFLMLSLILKIDNLDQKHDRHQCLYPNLESISHAAFSFGAAPSGTKNKHQ